jgi:hypothetical protein
LEATRVLIRLADHAKEDVSFTPNTALMTTRWHARFGAREFELLCTGPKFFDTRAGTGGGGAVDLVMHCLGLDFKGSVRYLQEQNL